MLTMEGGHNPLKSEKWTKVKIECGIFICISVVIYTATKFI